MTRRPIIAGNWKMHNLVSDSVSLVEEIMNKLSDKDAKSLPTVVVAPVYTSLYSVNEAISKCGCGKVNLSAQNCYFEEKGAFTGEESVQMLKDVGCSYIIIGHSERRGYFNESDEMINKKAKAILNNGLIPIICCGESLEQRENNETDAHLASQIKAALNGLTKDEIAKSVVAYEPIWAIGTGKTCDAVEANRTIKEIRNTIKELSDEATAQAVRILYGGSVKPETIKEQMAQSDIDGALVGGASLKAQSFVDIVLGAKK